MITTLRILAISLHLQVGLESPPPVVVLVVLMCAKYDVGCTDNFNLFWNCVELFAKDALHLSARGSHMLTNNILYGLHHKCVPSADSK